MNAIVVRIGSSYYYSAVRFFIQHTIYGFFNQRSTIVRAAIGTQTDINNAGLFTSLVKNVTNGFYQVYRIAEVLTYNIGPIPGNVAGAELYKQQIGCRGNAWCARTAAITGGNIHYMRAMGAGVQRHTEGIVWF